MCKANVYVQSIVAPCGRPNGYAGRENVEGKGKYTLTTTTMTTARQWLANAHHTPHTLDVLANTGGNSRTFQIY